MRRICLLAISMTLVSCLFYPAALLAGQPWTVAMVPVERQANGDTRPVREARFDRENFDGIGASARLNGRLFDAGGRYLVNVGDTWTWELHQLSSGPHRVAREQVSYLGGEDRCWSYGHCGALQEISVTIGPDCMANELYEIRLYFNDELVDRETFRPSRGGCDELAVSAVARNR
jgi:hypothetical protein